MRSQIEGRACAVLLALFTILMAPEVTSAICNAIPGATGVHRGAVGALNRPFASPGDFVGVEVNPAVCERLPGDLPGPALNSDPVQHIVTVLFTPPTASNGAPHAAVVASDCTLPAISNLVNACNATLVAAGGGAVCKTAAPGTDFLVVDEQTANGSPRRRLFFPFPNTDADFGFASDNRTLSGPAKIIVTPLGTALPCGMAAATPPTRCADAEGTLGEVACIDEIYAQDGTCNQSPSDIDVTFPHFTALPIPNDYASVCDPASDAMCTGVSNEVRFTTDAAGNAYVPWDYGSILKPPGADGLPIARIGQGLTSFPAFTGGSPISLPSSGFLTSRSPQGFLLPPLFTPLPDANANATTLFGSIDAERGVMRILRQSPTGQACIGGSKPGIPCDSTTVCAGGGACGAASPIFLFDDRYSDTGVGPVVVASSEYSVQANNSVQLSGIVETDQVLSLVVDEAVENQDLNGDSDMTDIVVTLADPTNGNPQPIGVGGASGLGVAREFTRGGVVPVVDAENDRVAFFVSEIRQQQDLNKDNDLNDTILMAFAQNSTFELTSGQDITQPLSSLAAFPVAAVNDNGGLTGPSLFLRNGLAVVGTSEIHGAQGTTHRISNDPQVAMAPPIGAFDGSASSDGRYVAFASFLSSISTPSSRQIFVVDRDTDVDGVFDETGATLTSLVGLSTTDAPIQLGSSSGTAVVNDGTANIAPARFVAFVSDDPNLVAGDTNGAFDVFVRDRDADNDGIFDEPAPASATARVSVNSAGQGATFQAPCGTTVGSSGDPAITPDGRFVIFFSTANNLVAGDTNGQCLPGPTLVGTDVFVHDRDLDADGIYDELGAISTARISVDDNGSQSILGNAWPSVLFFRPNTSIRFRLDGISDDGRIIAFDSNMAHDVNDPGHGACTQTYVHDRDTDADGIYDEPGAISTRLVSAPLGAPTADCRTTVQGFASLTSMTPNGDYIAFQSDFDDLVPGDTNGVSDVFVYHRPTGTVTRQSVDQRGREANGGNFNAYFVDDAGETLGFASAATNLIDDDEPRGGAIVSFFRSRVTGLVLRSQGFSTDVFTAISTIQFNNTGNVFTSPDMVDPADQNGADDVFSVVADATGSNVIRDFNSDGLISSGGYIEIVNLFTIPSSRVQFPAEVSSDIDLLGATTWLWPESNGGVSLNGDGDATDRVLAIHEGRDPVVGSLITTSVFPLTDSGLPLAVDQVAISVNMVAGVVPEADQGVGSLNGDGDATDRVVHVCSRQVRGTPICRSTGVAAAAGELAAIEPQSTFPRPWAVAFLASEAGQGGTILNGDGDANDQVLFLATAENPPQVVNTGLAADEFVVGDTFIAFRVNEAAQGGSSLNSDADTNDSVLHVLDLKRDPDTDPTAISSSGASAVLCDFDVCDPAVPYRVTADTVRFLTEEPDEQRDLNSDFDQLDLIVQLFNVMAAPGEPKVEVVGEVTRPVAGTTDPGAAVNPLAPPPFDTPSDNSQVFFTEGVCLDDTRVSCTVGVPGQCGTGEVCSGGSCQRRGATCAADYNCLTGTGEVCTPNVAAVGATNSDNDEIPDALDNCSDTDNSDQLDGDGDGVGDACDGETCGNGGALEGSEECDDGNVLNGDNCSRFCRIAGCAGDVNLDGRIDATDVDQFDDVAGCFGCTGPGCNSICDLNADGIVNNADVFALQGLVGQTCSQAGGGGSGTTGGTSCGLGAELALLLLPFHAMRRRRTRHAV